MWSTSHRIVLVHGIHHKMRDLLTNSTKNTVFHLKKHGQVILEPLKALFMHTKNGIKSISLELVSTSNKNEHESLQNIGPNFCSVTWQHSKGMKLDPLEVDTVPPLRMSEDLVNRGQNVLLHLPGRYMKKKEARNVLEEAKRIGVRSIFALQGERVDYFENKEDKYDFTLALDLVVFIKEYFGNYFFIAVAGYPDCHPETENLTLSVKQLKEKVDAGADLVVTQSVFSSETYSEFLKKCREIGIQIPILPGIWLFSTYKSLKNCTKFCNLNVPKSIFYEFNALKDDPENFRMYPKNMITKLVLELLQIDDVPGVHFFSLNNLSFAEEVYNNLDLPIASVPI